MIFGIRPDKNVGGEPPPFWWGARGIYHEGRAKLNLRDTGWPATIDIPPDRYSWGSELSGTCLIRKGMREVMSWFINKCAMPVVDEWINGGIKRGISKQKVHRGSADYLMVRELGFTFLASPMASHGYMYMGCWPLDGRHWFFTDQNEAWRAAELDLIPATLSGAHVNSLLADFKKKYPEEAARVVEATQWAAPAA